MGFWSEVLATFVGGILTSFVIVFFYVIFQWFLRATDIVVSYNWRFEALQWSPSLQIRNRSSSRTHFLGNIGYPEMTWQIAWIPDRTKRTEGTLQQFFQALTDALKSLPGDDGTNNSV